MTGVLWFTNLLTEFWPAFLVSAIGGAVLGVFAAVGIRKLVALDGHRDTNASQTGDWRAELTEVIRRTYKSGETERAREALEALDRLSEHLVMPMYRAAAQTHITALRAALSATAAQIEPAEKRLAAILAEALQGGPKYRNPEGFIRWGLVERDIKDAYRDALCPSVPVAPSEENEK